MKKNIFKSLCGLYRSLNRFLFIEDILYSDSSKTAFYKLSNKDTFNYDYLKIFLSGRVSFVSFNSKNHILTIQLY